MYNDLVFDFIAVLQILSRGGAEGKSISLDVSQGNWVKFWCLSTSLEEMFFFLMRKLQVSFFSSQFALTLWSVMIE